MASDTHPEHQSDAQRLGVVLRQARTAIGASQEYVAILAFGSIDRKGDISRLESGKNPAVTTETVRKVAVALEIDPSKIPERYLWPEAVNHLFAKGRHRTINPQSELDGDEGVEDQIGIISTGVGSDLSVPANAIAWKGGLPRLPRHFVARESFLRPIRERILSDHRAGETGTRPLALAGMGGLGKTVLATAVANDPQLAEYFGTERYWISVGQERKPTAAQAELYRELTGKNADIDTVAVGRKELRKILSGRPRLIIIDDIWDLDQAAAFEHLGGKTSVLVTTRQAAVYRRLGADPFELDVLTLEQSRDLIALWARTTPSDLPPCVDQIVIECGFLPLALAAFGAAVAQSGLDWEVGLAALRDHDLEDLVRPIEGYEGNEGVYGAIQLSFNTLAAADKEAFARCAILPADTSIPATILSALWYNLPQCSSNEHQQRRLCERLIDSSLLRREGTISGVVAYSIHDLISDYLRSQVPDLAQARMTLVEGSRGTVPWSLLAAKDDYLIDWLPWHLREARLHGELEDLLFDLDWLRRKILARGTSAVIADLKLLEGSEAARILAKALRLSSHILQDRTDQLEAQLFGRIPRSSNGRLGALYHAARSALSPSVLVPTPGGHLANSGSLVRTVNTQDKDIMVFCILADGRVLSNAADKNTMRLWDLDNGKSRVLEGHTDYVVGAAALADGRALSWSSDGTLRVWNLESGASETLDGHQGRVDGAAILKDGRLLSWSEDRTLRIWDLKTRFREVLPGHTGRIHGALSLDETHIISWAEKLLSYGERRRDPPIYHTEFWLWNLGSGIARKLVGHKNPVKGVIPLEGDQILSWSNDQELWLWDLKTGKAQTIEHNGPVWGTAVSPSARHLVSWWNNALYIHDLYSCRTVALEVWHQRSIKRVAVLPDHKIVSLSEDGAVCLWGSDNRVHRSSPASGGVVSGAVFFPHKQSVLWWMERENKAFLWNWEDGTTRTIAGHTDEFRGLGVLPDGRAVSWSRDSSLRVWDLDDASEPAFEGHRDAVRGVNHLSDGSILSWSADSLRIWDSQTHAERLLTGHKAAVNGATQLTDGRIVSWSDDGTLRCWEWETGNSQELSGHDGTVTEAEIVVGGRQLLSVSERFSPDPHTGGTLRAELWCWELSSGHHRNLEIDDKFSVLPHGIRGVMALPDEQALSWSAYGRYSKWDLVTGARQDLDFEPYTAAETVAVIQLSDSRVLCFSNYKEVRELDLAAWISPVTYNLDHSVLGAKLLPNDRILCWSDDHSVRILNLDLATECSFAGHTADINGATVLSDGRVLSWSEDQTLRLWDTKADARAVYVGDGPVKCASVNADETACVIGDWRGRVLTILLPATANLLISTES